MSQNHILGRQCGKDQTVFRINYIDVHVFLFYPECRLVTGLGLLLQKDLEEHHDNSIVSFKVKCMNEYMD